LMQAYGRDGLLDDDQIQDLTQYVLGLSGRATDTIAARRAEELFETTCSSCHGIGGIGDQSQGAPNLTDNEWLYGGDAQDIVDTLYNGRQGVMPNWNERLTPETISALAVYVHSLGGGVETPLENEMKDTP